MSSEEKAAVKLHMESCDGCLRLVQARLIHEANRQVLSTTISSGVTSPANPDLIGPYRILETLGEGGFGIVYLAEQTEPVRRRVALKLIKLGMDSRAVIGRFEAERQALAQMNHPHVARIFEAGTTDAALGNRPYFVMEHVQGVPITEHCDRNKLTIDERLDLFLQACEAIQHAHQKGIIHRDNRSAVVFGSVLALALLVSTVISSTFWRRETVHRRRALDALAAESKALDREQKRTRELEQVTQFLSGMLSSADPQDMGLVLRTEMHRHIRAGLERTWIEDQAGRMCKRTEDEIVAAMAEYDEAASPGNYVDPARNMLHVSILDPAMELAITSLESQPFVQYRLLKAIGDVYLKTGKYDSAEIVRRRCLALAREASNEALMIRRKLLGNEHREVANSLSNSASICQCLGDYGKAL